MAKQISINLNISNDPTMDAFGAYVAGSIEEGTAQVVMNVEATLTACAEHDIEFKDIIAETTLHELLHAIQELYGRAFNEAEVEDAIDRLRDYVAEQKMGDEKDAERYRYIKNNLEWRRYKDESQAYTIAGTKLNYDADLEAPIMLDHEIDKAIDKQR